MRPSRRVRFGGVEFVETARLDEQGSSQELCIAGSSPTMVPRPGSPVQSLACPRREVEALRPCYDCGGESGSWFPCSCDEDCEAFEMQVNAQVAARAHKSEEKRTKRSVTGGCFCSTSADNIVLDMSSSSFLARRGFTAVTTSTIR